MALITFADWRQQHDTDQPNFAHSKSFKLILNFVKTLFLTICPYFATELPLADRLVLPRVRTF